MNKIAAIIVGMLMALVLAACSDNSVDEIAGGGTDGQTDSYIAISINTGNNRDSRTADGTEGNGGNATLQDGDENEDKLINAYLLIFKGGSSTAPDNATLCGAFNIFDLGDGSGPLNGNVHISNRYKVKPLVLYGLKKEEGARYWGLVLSNLNDIDLSVQRSSITYKKNDGTSVTAGNVSFNTFKSEATLFLDGATTSTPSVAQSHQMMKGNGYILMTNAMMFDRTGKNAFWTEEDGTGSTTNHYAAPIELVEITDKITEREITADTPDEDIDWAVFHLERVAAKVQVIVDDKLSYTDGDNVVYGGVFTDTDGTKLDYIIEKWCIVNVSPETNLFRTWNEDWPTFVNAKSKNFRFISSTPHYTEVNGSETTNYYRGYFTKSSRYAQNGWATSNNFHYSNFHYQGWKDFGKVDYCHENTMQVENMMVKNATHVLVRVKFKKQTDENYGAAITSADGKTYTGGVAYYLLKIPHFGKDYTPWRAGESPNVLPLKPEEEMNGNEKADAANTVNIDRCYPNDATIDDSSLGVKVGGRNGNYLGRWGVVRNTWYKLKITGIVALGMNEVENPLTNPGTITNDPTPLDCYENWMYCTVKVNDWNVRDQAIVIQ